ncbi:MAG: hypothetical protein IPN94_17420 [Sphingobacteriales bacterium]|nr:hypothetical protein [Sphingobacteriales bacterium]
MRYFQLTKFFFTVCCCCLFVQQLQAQCIESSSGPTGLLPCNAANQALSITTNPAGLASSVQWSGSGVTGSGNSAIFDPDCALLGVKQLTPFLPAGTAIPQQNRNIGPFNGNLPATEQFCFDNICYGQGIVYNGLITGVINGSASDQVTICVTPPSGVSTCIGPLDLPLVNGQLSSGVDIGLLLNNAGDPNGCWNISVSGTANSYNLNLIPLAMTYPNGLSATVQGPPVSFTVVAELPPCPTFTSINAPTQVCSGSNVILSANTTPGNAQNISYVVTGSNGFSYTGINPPVDNPENTTCSPITVTYNVTVKCTNNNTTIGTQTVTATIYPEIDLSAVTIDNTSNINDPTCAVIVTAPCPDFTINGTPASASIPFGPGDNGSVANIIIGNGFGGCSATLSVPVTCIGNCVTPTTTVTTECSGSNNFKIRVSIADLGDATTLILEASQGAPITVTAAGDYLLGNFPNNTVVNVKALNPDNPSCNVNLGNFTQGCKPCPNITGIQVTNGGNICTGTTVSLNAQVTGGIDNTDYTVQWQLDGVDIPGGTGKNYAYNLIASGCQPQTHTFTAIVTCLTNGTPAANQSFTTNTITVYPIPEFGVDFFAPDNCSVTPVASPDCAPYLTMSTNPSPPGVALGQQVQVIYNVRVTGAPTSCRASGRYTVGCTDPATCTEDAGAMEPGVQTVCWGDDFAVVKSTPPLGLGFRNLITVTDELGTLVTTYGPYTSQDVVPPFAFTNNNSDPLYQAGKTYCFTPSLLFNGRDLNPGLPGTQNTYSQSGSASLPALDFDCVVDINSPNCTPEPYLYGFTVSGIPYCAGLSSYRITLVVNDNNITFNPWGGLAAAAGAGAYSSFPAPLDEQHDDGTWTLIYNGNPNGQTFNFVALQPNPLAGANINWSVTITLEDPPVFPVACPSCNDVGDAACVTLLQNPTLANITNPAPSCVGTTINLTDFNPDASQAGTYTWYNGDPSTTGTLISSPTAFVLNQNTTFYVKYQSNVGECEQMRNFTYNVNPLPTLNTPTVAPICPGATVNLSSLQPQITTAAGTFAWYIGDPDAGGAPLSNTTDVTPIGSERYYAVFTSTATGCKNKVYVSYTYNAIPVLLAQAPTVCAGTQVDLRSYEAAINANAGTFTWYNGNPDAGGTILTPNGNNQILVTPINGASYYVDYTNTATGCSNTARVVTFTVNALPTLATPTVTAVCAGTTVNLAQLQTNITTETGTFAWTSNGTSVANPAAVTLNATSSFTATFTSSATTCSKSVTFNYPVNPSPIILNANVVAPTVCANGLVDLTDYQPQISTDSNISFTWYAGNPNISPALVVGSPVPSENPQTQQLAANETRTYYAIVAKNTGCQDTVQLTANAYSTLTGGSATYDCAANQLVVDLSTVTGGSGTGYATVVADTLQQNGDVIPELTIWQVLFTDSQGCIGTLITDTVKCIACNPNVGVSIPPSVLTVDLSQTTPQSGAAQGFTTPHSEALQGTPDFSFGVTDENGVIIGLSQDGSFTYLDDNGQPLLPGTYCFTPLVYNNIQVDQVADGFVGAGNYQLADLLAIAGNLVSPLTLDTVRSLLPTLENLSGVELCIQLGETPDWCVVASYDIPCFTPNPPTNPQNNSYCTDAAPTPLSVTGGNDTLVVRWFDAQTGGNLLYTGNPYTPDQVGTYWVELARLFNEDECRSTRIAVTLTSATPPATANVSSSVTLSNGQNPDFPTTVDLDNLVTGNTAGTWTAPSGLTYNNTSHVVNANGKTPGVYTATYTINAPDPCADLVYTVVINVAGACQSPDATNPQGATYCITDAIPSISVDEPGSEYIVNWYAQEFGGNPIGTGASFTPPGPGTYWAGVARADDETCLSLNRVSATLTLVEPEDRPLIEALEMCLNYGTINPLVFADITPEGGTGTWSCVTPSAGCSATAFNPTAAGVGNYTIRYTVTNATCGTQTYDIPISVVATCNDAICNAAAGTALPPSSTTAYINNINPALNSAQASPGYATQPSNAAQGTPNHSFVVTDPTGIIVGLSLDGSFDFTGISPTGNYCFTGLAYDAGQIDAAADLLSTNPIVPAGALGTPADFHTLAELLEVVKDLGLINPFNIANVQAALPQLGAITGLTLCLNFNTTPDWCISVLSDEPCPSVPNPSGGSNQTYCNDGASSLPQLCVNDPGADFVVTWFDAASGGNVVGTGVCLSPTTTGDYWAEISSATRTECISTSRKKLTLTATQPPTAPTDFNTSGGLLYNDPQGGATSLNLSSLVTGGASGTWSAATGNPQSGVLSGSTVNANGAATGDYIFIYTINATAPCTALTYQTTVQVVDAGCLTAAHVPVATQTAISYCSNAAVPSISVQASSVANNEVVNWYNAANTLVGTGTSFTPTAAGVYCAQLAQADDATCVSSERACVTLTAVSPATATVTNTATAYVAAGQTTATVDLCSLTTNTAGTWSENGAGTITGCNFTAPEGVYTVQYTLPSGNATCPATVYNVTANIVNCGVIVCTANPGTPLPPANLQVCLNQGSSVSSPSLGFSTPPSGPCQGTPDYTYIVTDNGGIIVGVTNNLGEFDFAGLPLGSYCFTGLAYNTVQIDAAADALLGAGDYTLDDLLEVARTSGLVNPFTIANVAANLPLIGTLTGLSLCTGFGSSPAWCVDVIDVCTSTCTTPAAPTAVNPTNTICTGSTIPALSVTTAAGTSVKWYNTPTGGTSIATGNSFTPTACGTYYAETWNATPADCFSATRTALTVTCVAPPTSAVVTASANINKASCPTGNNLSLSGLIASGNTGGTWTSTAGGTIAGNSFTAANAGTYTLTYTIAGTSPCANLTYTCVVTVINCSCVAPAAPTAVAANLTACEGSALPALQVTTVANTNVNWFAAAVGGTSIATGTSFTPNSCGVYYAETFRLDDATCVSTTRTAITLTCVTPITVSVTPITVFLADGATTADVDLTTLNLPQGTWALGDCGGTITNNIYTGNEGTCTLTYTINQPSPCADNSINVSVTIVGCGVITCEPFVGEPIAPTNLCVDANNTVSAASTGFSVSPSGACQGTPDYTFIVTDSDGIIVDVTNNVGEFDFASLPYGNYCFTGLLTNTSCR